MTERIHPLAVVYTVDQFCAMHAISRDTFDRLVGRGELATFKIGRRRYVAKAEAERWLSFVHVPVHVSGRGVGRKPAASSGKPTGASR
jgi:excisionase family DNA binding protein